MGARIGFLATMKLLRLLWRFFSTFCLLMVIAAGAVWVRSYREGDPPDHYLLLQAEPRRCFMWLSVPGEGILAIAPRYVLRNFGGDWEKRMVVPGIERAVIAEKHRTSVWFVRYWAVMAFALVPTAVRAGQVVGARRKRRRGSSGECVECGYDLRATPGRCPECGRVVGAG